MNAMVMFNSNATGVRNATPEERVEAAQKLASSIRSIAAAYSRLKAVQSVPSAKSAEKAAETTTATGSREINNALDRDAFLQLLTLQMQNQDPLDPMDNTDMIAQLAQFSSLEQMQNLNTSFEQLSSNFAQSNFISASALVGKSLTGADAEGKAVQGVISSVAFENGVVYFVVGESRVAMSNVRKVE